jgi:hypothetical protein
MSSFTVHTPALAAAAMTINTTADSVSSARAQALEGARRIAYVSRAIFEVMANLMADKNVPESILPVGIYGALGRLAYALTALAEDEPDPEALLSPAELDGLAAQYEIEDWVARGRERNPDFPDQPR